jgi:predicted DNA-binding transcriptional regulator AlpA
MIEQTTSFEDVQFVTAAEVMNILKISRVTLWRLIRHRNFPAPAKMGSMKRWPLSEIRQWQENLLTERL